MRKAHRWFICRELVVSVLALTILNAIPLSGCHKEPSLAPDIETGQVAVVFTHVADGLPVLADTLLYTNKAGNQFMVTEIQYFISHLYLHRGADSTPANTLANEHYVDVDIPSTLEWLVPGSLPADTYDSVSFTFGFDSAANRSFRFVNPPESNMVWPEVLGGGYHYMKLNLKWLDSTATMRGFNCHLGIGQKYDDQHEVTTFLHNHFRVKLPLHGFVVARDRRSTIALRMEVQGWFNVPNVFDFTEWGGGVMQSQTAMSMIIQNGRKVFAVHP